VAKVWPQGWCHTIVVAGPKGGLNAYVWKTALAAAGIEPSRANGMHALRHFHASVLLDAGESIKALSEYLGHSDPGFTLRTYTHLLPTSEQRTRQAVDRALTGGAATADGLPRGPANQHFRWSAARDA
jgi:integrase